MRRDHLDSAGRAQRSPSVAVCSIRACTKKSHGSDARNMNPFGLIGSLHLQGHANRCKIVQSMGRTVFRFFGLRTACGGRGNRSDRTLAPAWRQFGQHALKMGRNRLSRSISPLWHRPEPVRPFQTDGDSVAAHAATLSVSLRAVTRTSSRANNQLQAAGTWRKACQQGSDKSGRAAPLGDNCANQASSTYDRPHALPRFQDDTTEFNGACIITTLSRRRFGQSAKAFTRQRSARRDLQWHPTFA